MAQPLSPPACGSASLLALTTIDTVCGWADSDFGEGGHMARNWFQSDRREPTDEAMTMTRFLRVGPDTSRRAFIALAVGSSAAVVMPMPSAAAATVMILIDTPCAPEQTYEVTTASCQIVETMTPAQQVAEDSAS
jgi:hypothetical protein